MLHTLSSPQLKGQKGDLQLFGISGSARLVEENTEGERKHLGSADHHVPQPRAQILKAGCQGQHGHDLTAPPDTALPVTMLE